MKILLVDDDEFLRDMYATKFEEAGHETEAVGSGERAISYLETNTADVVITDMVMPGMTGIDIIKKIKSEQLGGDPKCIVLSNQGEGEDIEAATREGAIGYLVKASLIPSEVVSKVEALIKA